MLYVQIRRTVMVLTVLLYMIVVSDWLVHLLSEATREDTHSSAQMILDMTEIEMNLVVRVDRS